MTILTENRMTGHLPVIEDIVAPRNRLAAHLRDVDLFGKLFSSWTRGRRRHTAEIDHALDAIEAQLARLEQTVTMTAAA